MLAVPRQVEFSKNRFDSAPYDPPWSRSGRAAGRAGEGGQLLVPNLAAKTSLESHSGSCL